LQKATDEYAKTVRAEGTLYVVFGLEARMLIQLSLLLLLFESSEDRGQREGV